MKICTVARDGDRTAVAPNGISGPIWTGAVYEARARAKDGVLTWRRVGSFGGTRSGRAPSPSFVAELKTLAKFQWRDGIRHGMLVTDAEESEES